MVFQNKFISILYYSQVMLTHLAKKTIFFSTSKWDDNSQW